MGGSVIFYTYGSTLELNGHQLTAGMLTAGLLNLSPDEYLRLKKRMTQITDLAKEYERKRDIALWWKLNEKMDALCQKLRRYQVFRLLLDEDEDAFFSAIREITEQFSVFPTEDQAPTAEAQKRQLERVANQFSQRSEDAPLDLFHPSEADLEKGKTFYYELLRAFGPTKDAWRGYQKYLDRYALYLHDIRAFNETIRNFIQFSLSKLDHNSPEEYAKALYGFYNDERIAEKLIVNPIRNNGDCYTTPRRLRAFLFAAAVAGRLRCYLSGARDRQLAGADESGLYAGAEQRTQRPPLHHLRTVFPAQERRPRVILRRGVSPRARLHLPAVWFCGGAEGAGEGHSQGQSQGDRLCPHHEGSVSERDLTGGRKKSQGLCAGSAL